MSGKSTKKLQTDKSAPFVLGRARFEKIMAVEGRFLTDEQQAMFEEFDRLGLTAEERRRAILQKTYQ